MPKTQASCTFNSRKSRHFCQCFHSHSGQVRFLKSVSYKELNRATDQFRRIITCDSQSITYEAKFDDGSVSVVREVKSVDQENELFYKELQLLRRLNHRHVVSLRGYSVGRKRFDPKTDMIYEFMEFDTDMNVCSSVGVEFFLVFESTAKGSLKEHLNGNFCSPSCIPEHLSAEDSDDFSITDPLKTPLSWKTRVQIAVSVAAAIVIKSDILPQFGALLLELITGQSSARESADVIQWIRELRSNLTIHNMIDPDLGISHTSKELTDLLTVARLCIKVEGTQVFTISHVSWYLQTRFGSSCT
ncbi:hypothetical protein RDABS01_000646 [Bienertia sinuspersici]